MGPTASGKTPLAIKLVQQFPCEIISVDSAMIYRGMDIGTAKPDKETLSAAPHRLIDILDPREAYSAGQFRRDALREIDDILAGNKIPLLVGGTMMYFRILLQGLAELPQADHALRHELQSRARQEGWEALHAYLSSVDPAAARRIHPSDSQRIQRALEVFLLTGKNLSSWLRDQTRPLSGYHVYQLALAPSDRLRLHERIALRFDQMLSSGLVEEVRRLFLRTDLSPDLPSMRSVGYRQIWEYLAGDVGYDDMREKAVAATRQLAKRQMTWLRSWNNLEWLDAESKEVFDQASRRLDKISLKNLP
ncbi:tRNA (adenosine(37)-N6)-dimethylallyltransferase MiaA [Aquicella siphonis]